MKILRLRLSNLNSLRDEWAIDFSVSPLADAGLFAITGPTGAGKTTILDAITLALYGRAARYGDTKNPEQIMSKHTGVCSAEVEFSCASGVFRSVWQLRRARNKPSGAIQSAERKVIALPEEEVLTQKLQESNDKIEEITGLNYDRFLRSVMLAQGDFAAFLKARPTERTELLEQVTGTRIYSEISVAAFEQHKSAAASHTDKLRRMESVQLLPGETRAERTSQITLAQSRLEEIRGTLGALEVRLVNARSFIASQNEVATILRETEILTDKRRAAAGLLDALARHDKAAPFIARITTLDQISHRQTDDGKKLAALQTNRADLQERIAKAQSDLESARLHFQTTSLEEETLKPLWRETAALDGEIAVAQSRLSQLRAARGTAELSLAKLSKDLLLRQETLDQEAHRISEMTVWLDANRADAAITPAIPELQTALARLEDQSFEIQKIADEIATLETAIAQNESALTQAAGTETAAHSIWQEKLAFTEKLKTELVTLTENHDIAWWENQREATQNRERKWQELHDLGRNLAELTQEKLRLEKQIEEFAVNGLAGEQRHGELSRQLEIALDLLASRQRTLDLSLLVQSLEEHRRNLVSGDECPLCGAIEHPFAGESHLPSDSIQIARNELKQASVVVETHRLEITSSAKNAMSLAKDREHTIAALEKLSGQIRALQSLWEMAVEELKVDCQPENDAVLTEQLSAAQATATALRKRVQTLRDLDDRHRKSETLAADSKTLWQEKTAGKNAISARLQHARENLEKCRSQKQSRLAAHEQALEQFNFGSSAFGITASNSKAAPSNFDILKKRSELFLKKSSDHSAAEAELRAGRASCDELRKQLETAATECQRIGLEEAAESIVSQKLKTARLEKLGTISVEADKERLALAIQASRQKCESATRVATDLQQNLSFSEKQIAEIETSFAERALLLFAQSRALTDAALAAGFSSIEMLREAVLPENDLQQSISIRNSLNDAEQNLLGRQKANLDNLARLPISASNDSLTLDRLQENRAVHEDERQQLEQSRGAWQEELRQDDLRRESQRQLAMEMEMASRELQRWTRLNNLIGSAEGTKFAQFAQSLTLERLVAVANRHLATLNPRYSMRRSNARVDDLEIEIIDHYQAGISRPMRSLSGGESFLASLALAVGLSDLASGRIAIESLFIDEGFGTLDAETLEIALSALESLQATGKTIGVISHVDAMKDRISTQIQVRKREGGRSVIQIVS